MTSRFNQNIGSGKLRFYGGYFLFIAVLFALFDVIVGAILIDEENTFRNYPLPPYGAVMTEAQQRGLEKLKSPDPNSYILYDQHLGWTVGPKRVSRDGQYISNSAGMRSAREYTLKIPDGVIRIAAFGDSYTECGDVGNKQAWPYLLEQSFDNLEVLNFGVRAYGTDQALLRYEKDGRPFNPHVVFIGFLLENIRRNVSRYRPAYEHNTGGLGVKPRFLITDDGLTLLPNPVSSRQHLLRLIVERKLLEAIGENDYWYQRYKFAFNQDNILFRLNFLKLSWLVYEKYQRNLKKFFGETDAEPFVLTSRLLETFYEEALNDGAKETLVIIFPAKSQIEFFIKNETKYWQPLLDFLEENRIQYLDMTKELAKEHVKNPIIYGHYTPKGNQIVSTALGEWFKEILLRTRLNSNTILK